MSGPENKLVYSPGNERIPEGWFTRPAADPYTALSLFMDIQAISQKHPELVAFGGNTGTVNSFTGVNAADLTVSSPTFPAARQSLTPPPVQGGAYNSETLLQGNNLGCFLYQSVAAAAPDLIRQGGVIADVVGAVAKINSAVAQVTSGLGCPQLSKYDYNPSQLSKYPGYTKLTKQGTY